VSTGQHVRDYAPLSGLHVSGPAPGANATTPQYAPHFP
jgi:hypothetical protein